MHTSIISRLLLWLIRPPSPHPAKQDLFKVRTCPFWLTQRPLSPGMNYLKRAFLKFRVTFRVPTNEESSRLSSLPIFSLKFSTYLILK